MKKHVCDPAYIGTEEICPECLKEGKQTLCPDGSGLIVVYPDGATDFFICDTSEQAQAKMHMIAFLLARVEEEKLEKA